MEAERAVVGFATRMANQDSLESIMPETFHFFDQYAYSLTLNRCHDGANRFRVEAFFLAQNSYRALTELFLRLRFEMM